MSFLNALMARISTRPIFAIVLGFWLLALSVETRADFIAKLNTTINGAAPTENDPTQPYITATFHTVATGKVTVTISASNLVDSGGTVEFVKTFLFNVAPAIMPSTLTFAENTGPTTVITALGDDAQTGGNQVKAGLFDIMFGYNSNAFTSADTPAVYTITGNGITAESFAFSSTRNGGEVGGPYVAAADIAGIPGSLSGSVGALTETPVPEPSSLALVGIRLGTTLVLLRRRRPQSHI